MDYVAALRTSYQSILYHWAG